MIEQRISLLRHVTVKKRILKDFRRIEQVIHPISPDVPENLFDGPLKHALPHSLE
jgi:hypothetical protein